MARGGNVLLSLMLVSSAPYQDEWWRSLPRPEWALLPQVSIDQPTDWFEVYEAAPGVFALYEPGHAEEALAYLILGSERALLFDTLMGIGNLRAVVDQLTDLPVVVLNSHSHFDHVGDNHRFDQILGLDSDYTRGNATGVGPEVTRRFMPAGAMWKPTPPGFSVDTYAIAPWNIDDFVSDGDIIDLGDRQLEVMVTPGHAPDAICLLDREHRLLFTGDTYYRGPIYAHLPGSDLADYAATVARLGGLGDQIDLLMPGHNTTAVSAEDLAELAATFEAILSGSDAYAITGEVRVYESEHFRVLTRHPAQ